MSSIKVSDNNFLSITKPISWPVIVGQFLNSADLKASTLLSYKRRLQQWINWLDKKGIQFPSADDLILFKKELSDRCSSTLTICNYLTAVRSLLSWTHRRGIYPNISKEVRSPIRPRGHRKDCLEIEQIKSLLDSIDRNSIKGKRNYAICKLFISTGLRGIEVHRANIEDIRKVKGKWLLYVQGKGRDDKSEFVVLMPKVLNAIEDYLFHKSTKALKGPIFTSTSSNFSGRLSTRSIRGIVKNGLRQIGIDTKRISAHSMRHSPITISLAAGCGLQETKEMARHSSIDTTLGYAHNLKLLSNPVFESIESLIENECL